MTRVNYTSIYSYVYHSLRGDHTCNGMLCDLTRVADPYPYSEKGWVRIHIVKKGRNRIHLFKKLWLDPDPCLHEALVGSGSMFPKSSSGRIQICVFKKLWSDPDLCFQKALVGSVSIFPKSSGRVRIHQEIAWILNAT